MLRLRLLVPNMLGYVECVIRVWMYCLTVGWGVFMCVCVCAIKEVAFSACFGLVLFFFFCFQPFLIIFFACFLARIILY